MAGEILIWDALEYEHRPKTNDWYWTAGLAGVVIATLAFWYGNWLFGILAILTTATVILAGARHPEEVRYTITRQGVTIAQELFPFERIGVFSIDAEDGLGHLTFRHSLVSHLSLPLGEISAEDIRTALGAHLKELQGHMTLTHALSRRVGL